MTRLIHQRGTQGAVDELLTPTHLRVAEALAIQIVAGRLSSTRTEQLAHLAMTRAARDYDPASGEALLPAALPRLRRDLHNMVEVTSARTEQHTPPPELCLCVDAADAGDDLDVTGPSIEELVRRIERACDAKRGAALNARRARTARVRPS